MCVQFQFRNSFKVVKVFKLIKTWILLGQGCFPIISINCLRHDWLFKLRYKYVMCGDLSHHLFYSVRVFSDLNYHEMWNFMKGMKLFSFWKDLQVFWECRICFQEFNIFLMACPQVPLASLAASQALHKILGPQTFDLGYHFFKM